ncbi:hypothetical protein D8674_010801 [Pyrus ussuriensis x Pyrus communis]|uniref:Uncharacterized protein n=1 Tax=Pyrus ussuriensis x Pyrus communis TaxID=2448454 RepID=A0A5N5FX33_9ROSA|nr:hypothetical protein D8674_010801 [Pyrus ussuriensis x Pyrus communis]
MCPLRFILLFFSAILAGYFAWRTVRSSPAGTDIITFSQLGTTSINENMGSSKHEQEAFNFKFMIQNGFWVLVDMASGKYLWRNFKEMNEGKVKC